MGQRVSYSIIGSSIRAEITRTAINREVEREVINKTQKSSGSRKWNPD